MTKIREVTCNKDRNNFQSSSVCTDEFLPSLFLQAVHPPVMKPLTSLGLEPNVETISELSMNLHDNHVFINGVNDNDAYTTDLPKNSKEINSKVIEMTIRMPQGVSSHLKQ